jgi:hypothetical protein
MFAEELVFGTAVDCAISVGGVGNSSCGVEEDVDESDGVGLRFALRLNANFGLGAADARRSSSFCPKVFNCYKFISAQHIIVIARCSTYQFTLPLIIAR